MTEIGPGWSNIIAPILQDEHHADAAAQKVVLRGTDGTNFYNAAVVSTASGPALVTLGGGGGSGGTVEQGTPPWTVSIVSSMTLNVSGSFQITSGSTVHALQGGAPWTVSVVSSVTNNVVVTGIPTISVVSQVTTPVVITGTPIISVVSQVTTPVVITGTPIISVVSQVTTPVVITGTPIISVVSQVTTNVVVTGTPSIGVVSCLSLNVNTEFPEAAALSDTLTNPTTPIVGSAPLVWSPLQSQWQRARVFEGTSIAAGSSQIVQGVVGIGLYGINKVSNLGIPASVVPLGGGISNLNNGLCVNGAFYMLDSTGSAFLEISSTKFLEDLSVTDRSLAVGISVSDGGRDRWVTGTVANGLDVDVTRVSGTVVCGIVSCVTHPVVVTGTPTVSVVSNVTTNVVITGTPTISVVSHVTTNVVRSLYRGTLTTILSTFTLGSGTTTVNSDSLTITTGPWIELEYTITSFGVGAHRVQILPQFSNDGGTTWASVDSGPETNMHFEDTEFATAKSLMEILPSRGAALRVQAKATGVSDTLLFATQVRARERQSP